MDKKSLKNLIVFIIIGIIGTFILNSVSNKLRLAKEGIVSFAIIDKITYPIKSSAVINYSYVINEITYKGSDHFSRLDRNHYKIGDRLLVLYLPNEIRVSMLFKDNQKNNVFYLNFHQVDSINSLRSNK